MGGLYMYTGSGLYVWQILRLRDELGIGPIAVGWALFNAFWPCALWSMSLACLLDETPEWLLAGLCSVEHLLPSALRASFFLPARSLEPIVHLLETCVDLEEMRLQTVLPEGLTLASSASWRSSRIVRRVSGADGAVLTNRDYATVITQRLERLKALQAKLQPLAREGSRAIPTTVVLPLVDRLQTTAADLAEALEADVQRCERERAHALLDWLRRPQPTPREGLLTMELEAARTLKRRCDAVKRDNVSIE